MNPPLTARYMRQDDQLWRAQIEEDPQIHVAARSLQAAHDNIREAVRIKHELDEVPEVVDSFGLSPTLLVEIDAMYQLLEQAERMAEKANEQAARTARVLVEAGFSLRDAAVVLRCSHARVQQLLHRST